MLQQVVLLLVVIQLDICKHLYLLYTLMFQGITSYI